ncbi:serine/threonine-protein kinase 33-like isoform X2 [Liolophura sinensis]
MNELAPPATSAMAARKGSAEKLTTIAHTRIEDKSMIEESYSIGEKLGQGTFGKVYAATHKDTKVKWAIKSVNKEKAGGPAIKLLEREVAILKRVNHEHIIRLNEVFETAEKMFLVMELCQGGELADELKKRGYFSESDTKNLMQKLASAISYLHKNDIVHRDLKLENILLSQNPNDPTDKLHIKVTDFGLSVVKGGAGHENMMQAFCGTPIYMAPEILDNRSYSQQCDVWAMGVIMYLLLTGRPPFTAKDDDTLYELIKKGEVDFSDELWVTVSDDAQNIIVGMLNVDPAHRLTAHEVLDHSWFTGQKRETRNALALMKEWKDELRLESQQPTDSSAINGESADTSEAEYPNVPLDTTDTTEPKVETEKTESESHQSESTLKPGNSSPVQSVKKSPSSRLPLSRKSPGLSSHNIGKSSGKRSPPIANSSSNRATTLHAGKPAPTRSSVKLGTPTSKSVLTSKATGKKK